MGLPRSVIEMSHDDFKPRRCRSGAFRGFSFIQEDFILPERSVSNSTMSYHLDHNTYHLYYGKKY